MTEPVFGPAYADAYDWLYGDKDYKAESALVVEIAAEMLGRRPRTVLDLGCGTGSHDIELAKMGLSVDGVDRSEEMLSIARSRTASLQDRIRLIHGDVRTVRTDRTYDLVMLMFAVLGYQIGDADVDSALLTARAHMEVGSALIFDVWYGPAVRAIGPESRAKRVPAGTGWLERSAHASLNQDSTATVHYELRSGTGESTLRTDRETHRMRYFDIPELKRRLRDSGLELQNASGFPDVSAGPDETTWNILVSALAA